MSFTEIIILAIGLSMDALAASVSDALSDSKMNIRKAVVIAFLFGIFQGIMPLTGFYAVSVFKDFIQRFAPWVAFIILLFLGNKMLFEALKEKKEEKNKDTVIVKEHILTYKMIFVQAVATSIDALAAGISLAALNVSIFKAVSIISLITFAICFAAILLSIKIGNKIKDGKVAEIIGGIILVLIGSKIILEHLFFK